VINSLNISATAMFACWKSLVRHRNSRTFCVPDAELRKDIVVAYRLLDMLGGVDEHWQAFIGLETEPCNAIKVMRGGSFDKQCPHCGVGEPRSASQAVSVGGDRSLTFRVQAIANNYRLSAMSI
jgi:hypothetical protein